MQCKRCGATSVRRNGKVRGAQRYFCRECHYSFLLQDRRKCGGEYRAQIVGLYLHGMTPSEIASCIPVPVQTIYRWIAEIGGSYKRPEATVLFGTADIETLRQYLTDYFHEAQIGSAMIVKSGDMLMVFPAYRKK